MEKRGFESPRLDVEILMAHALGLKRLDLYLQFDRPLQDAELAAIRKQVVARGEQQPVAYLVGEREFHSLAFAVDARVLVPRPETEHLVEVALERLKDDAAPVVADIGTGSGCIAIALLHELPAARAHATDTSSDALAVARTNAERHAVAERLALHEGDLLEPLRAGGDWGAFAAVLSNPPYIVRGDPSVEVGVLAHEPEVALFVPGDDPLELARRIAIDALEALGAGGFVALEVGHESGAAAGTMLGELGYANVEVLRDLGGIERVAVGVKS